MFARRELDALRARKEALLRASEINRARLLTEVVPCRTVAAWVDTGRELASQAGSILGGLAPLASLWRRPSADGFLPKLAQGFTFARSVARLWSTVTQRH